MKYFRHILPMLGHTDPAFSLGFTEFHLLSIPYVIIHPVIYWSATAGTKGVFE